MAYKNVPCLVLLSYEDSENEEDASEVRTGIPENKAETLADQAHTSYGTKDTPGDLLEVVKHESKYPEDTSEHAEDGSEGMSLFPKDSPTTSSAQPVVKGYALLPRAFKISHPEVIADFARHHIQVIPNVENEPAVPLMRKKYSLMLFEAELSSVDERQFPEVRLKNPGTSVFVWLHVYGYDHNNDRPGFLDQYTYDDFFKCGYINNRHFCKPMEQENLKVIEELLRRGAKINYGHPKGGTLLHYAVKRCQKALVELVLKYGADVEAERDDPSVGFYKRTDSQGGGYAKNTSVTRPLYSAAKRGFANIVQVLLNHGAVHDFETYKPRYTPLEVAFSSQKLEVFKLLLDAHVKTNTDFQNQLTLSKFLRKTIERCVFCPLKFVQLILLYRPSVTDRYNKTTFYLSLCSAQMKCFEAMKLYGFRMDYDDVENSSLLLFGAIVNNWVEEVRNLIEGGADVNKVGDKDDLKHLPIHKSQFALVPRVDYNKEPASEIPRPFEYFTPLHVAAAFAGEEVIKLLLAHGSDINATLENRPPLYDACRTRNLNAVRFLIANKACVQHDAELMNLAVDGGNPELVELLLLNRTPLSTEDSELQGLLVRAIGRHNLEVMNVLLRFIALPDADFDVKCRRNSYGSRHHETLELLLDHSFTNLDFALYASKISSFFKKGTSNTNIFYCPGCSLCVDSCFRLLACHIIKLESVGHTFPNIDVSSIWLYKDSIVEFRNDCEAEVVRLKAERVGNLNVTLYDILTGSVDRLAIYARNKSFEETKNSGDYKKSFPIFASVLSCQFQKGFYRRKLLDCGVKICSKLNIFFKRLPDLVKEEIIKNLNNYNLELLNHENVQFVRKTL